MMELGSGAKDIGQYDEGTRIYEATAHRLVRQLAHIEVMVDEIKSNPDRLAAFLKYLKIEGKTMQDVEDDMEERRSDVSALVLRYNFG